MIKLIRAKPGQTNLLKQSVVTIGNFDGVHLGHQEILTELCAKARELNMPAVVILFEPQPQEFFRADQAPARLMRLREKLMALRQYPIDHVVCFRFNQPFSHITADAFIQDILIQQLHVNYLIVGEDFRFGHARQGTIATLQQAATHHGFTVAIAPTVLHDNARISSTRVRAMLQEGNFAKAAELLGSPYGITGRVIHGNKIGRQLDCPTANILLFRKTSPLWGIYIATVSGVTERALPAVVSIGKRPVFNGTEMLLEIHLLNVDYSLYGKLLRVELIQKLRDEQNFASVDDLKHQIVRDVAAAERYFSKS
jgi:riboflavin kinase/FMN adenylyltransferase